MAKLSKDERQTLARHRIAKILRTAKLATWRTLEQKISDAGPGPMRVDPHVLTEARNSLLETGALIRKQEALTYYHLESVDAHELDAKLQIIRPLWAEVSRQDVTMRMGQALEIAAYRAFLLQPKFHTFGSFLNLDEHGDEKLYKKEEPPSSISGRTCVGRLDFLVICEGDLAGVELKNVREWLYPNRKEVRELIQKCLALNAVPVLIGRRIPFVTFKLLNTCGVIIHQTYNQLYANADAELAARAKDKSLLGFHDIRVGNLPDARLLKFITMNLAPLIPTMRPRFDGYRDLLEGFVTDTLSYAEFAARVRRRAAGTDEDSDWAEDD